MLLYLAFGLCPKLEILGGFGIRKTTELAISGYLSSVSAVEQGVKDLLGYDPNLTPLHNAALAGKFDMFQYIYENAKNKNPIDHDGDTPLHKAANGGGQFKHCEYWMRSCHHHKICQLILDNVENKTTENFDGKTPLQMATESNHSLVLDVLTPKDVKKTKANLNQRSCKAKRFKDK